MRWLLWYFCLLAESYGTINHYHYQLPETDIAKTLSKFSLWSYNGSNCSRSPVGFLPLSVVWCRYLCQFNGTVAALKCRQWLKSCSAVYFIIKYFVGFAFSNGKENNKTCSEFFNYHMKLFGRLPQFWNMQALHGVRRFLLMWTEPCLHGKKRAYRFLLLSGD